MAYLALRTNRMKQWVHHQLRCLKETELYLKAADSGSSKKQLFLTSLFILYLQNKSLWLL